MVAPPEPRPPGPRRLWALPSALTIVHQLAGHGPPALFLDYDGTLTPIATRPEQAALASRARQVLAQLARRGFVAIVSGRDRPDLERLVGLPTLWYAGSHGFDIAGPAPARIRHEPAREYLDDLAAAEDHLGPLLAPIEGAWVERKRYAVAVHDREVREPDRHTIAEIVTRAAASLPQLRVRTGKRIHELQPAIDWDKGRAVLWLLARDAQPEHDAHPVYLGDDETDEDAFRALQGRGTTIVVGDEDRMTAAAYGLRNPDDVHLFLETLLGVIPEAKGGPRRTSGSDRGGKEGC